jgi:hypothetical protein
MENTDKPNIKAIAIIGLVVVAVVSLIIASFLSKSKKTPLPQTSRTGPTPTLIQHPQSSSTGGVQRSDAIPTLIPIDTFTGAAKEQDIPKEDTELAVQKRNLRRKAPLAADQFTITFNYETDKFTVTLKDPKENAKKTFTEWLGANYPMLPLDRFEIR